MSPYLVQFYTIYSHHIWINFILYSHHIWINYILYSHHIWINSRNVFGCFPEMLVLLEINVLKKRRNFCVLMLIVYKRTNRETKEFIHTKLLVVLLYITV